MIWSFRSREAEALFNRLPVRRIPPDIQRSSLRKLRMLNRAESLQDLRVPPANCLRP
jgi:proteic killer suppression protein